MAAKQNQLGSSSYKVRRWIQKKLNSLPNAIINNIMTFSVGSTTLYRFDWSKRHAKKWSSIPSVTSDKSRTATKSGNGYCKFYINLDTYIYLGSWNWYTTLAPNGVWSKWMVPYKMIVRNRNIRKAQIWNSQIMKLNFWHLARNAYCLFKYSNIVQKMWNEDKMMEWVRWIECKGIKRIHRGTLQISSENSH